MIRGGALLQMKRICMSHHGVTNTASNIQDQHRLTISPVASYEEQQGVRNLPLCLNHLLLGIHNM